MKPIGIDPTSPKNILAGGLLTEKKAKNIVSIINPKYKKSVLIKPIIEKIFVQIAIELTCTAVIPSIPSIKLNKLITHTQLITKRQIIKTIINLEKVSSEIFWMMDPRKICKSSWNTSSAEMTQKNWKVNLILELTFLKSSKRDIENRIPQNPKINIQFWLSKSFKKKISRVEKIKKGIKIKPAPLGLIIEWLLLSVGLSNKESFSKNPNDFFKTVEVKTYKDIIITILIFN